MYIYTLVPLLRPKVTTQMIKSHRFRDIVPLTVCLLRGLATTSTKLDDDMTRQPTVANIMTLISTAVDVTEQLLHKIKRQLSKSQQTAVKSCSRNSRQYSKCSNKQLLIPFLQTAANKSSNKQLVARVSQQ